MATKIEIKTLLKELNLTEEDMQRFWDECKEINWKVKTLTQHGKNWTDMAISVIKDLPNLKKKTLQIKEYKGKEKEEEKLAAEKKKSEAEYCKDHFDELMLKKIDSGENLTEKELKTLAFEYEIDRTYGENRRWTRMVESIVKLGERFFCVNWEEGLTECQENEFYKQPYEVKEHTYKKTIVVTEWVPI